MKKTLIALVVAAFTAKSGIAMAWVNAGTGDNIKLSGTLNPVTKVTPWEVQTGNGATLNAELKPGQTATALTVHQAIPILSIRSNGLFSGQSGISPRIDFQGAVDVAGFDKGVTTLTLDVSNEEGTTIGKMTAPFNAAAVISLTNSNVNDQYTVVASPDNTAFVGGNAGWGKTHPSPETMINSLSSEIMAKFDYQGMSYVDGGVSTTFDSTGATYCAAYGSGILVNDIIKLTLEKPATENVTWRASLPVSVIYM